MSGDTTVSDWEGFDSKSLSDRGLIGDISQTLNNFSSDKRAKRQLQKLREQLVREHIEDKSQPKSVYIAVVEWFSRRF